ncbi:MAG: enoyl-CoA hydratase-related protein [Cellvibrionaceae bacterium]
MSIENNTPILVGVGQVTEQVPEELTLASSHADLAAQAAKLALSDALDDSLAQHIDTIVGVRTFADSTPTYACPFGGSNNFPRSVGNRIGADPARAVYEIVGGQSPQKLVGEFFEELHQGRSEMVLLAGGEVMANIKVAGKKKVKLDWNESIEGQLEDRGMTDGEHLITRLEFEHKLMNPIQFYGLMEQARRGDKQENLAIYSQKMGECFSKLSQVASENPLSVNQNSYSAEELITPADDNKMLTSPYTKHLVAKDGVNQAAALLLTTVGKAKELGIDETQWVYLHGYADTKERVLLKRDKIGHSKAMEQALLGCLSAAGKTSADLAHMDIYSCFPIVVNEAKDILDIADNDPRPLTQTGGLAFFGGPGNNYTMHGIAALVETLRKDAGSFGLAYGNGGWMSKHSAGVYSTAAPSTPWQACSSNELQDVVNADPMPEVDYQPEGEAILEAYTVNYFQGNPLNSVVIGRLKHNQKRFYAANPFFDQETLQQTLTGDVLGKTIYVQADPKGNRYAYSQAQVEAFKPEVIDTFQDSYEFCQVERDGPILKVTINRPEARNALHPPANQELENIFNAYEKDKSLWVAIITGAEAQSFSAGNDLKYMASGQEMWVPRTGFAGLTSRTNRTKPVIAAVNGLALGGGLEIAMACDLIVAADHAKFGLPEVKVGLFAGAGGVQRLSRQIGVKNAMEMMLTGEPIDCDKALNLGLINHVVPADQVMSKAEALAQQITQVSPMSVRSSMQLLNETSQFASTDEAVTYPHTVFDNLLNSEDFFEGSAAFAAKRPPKWTGR